MNNDKLTTIIAADYMYLIFLGSNIIIDKIIKKLNKKVDVRYDCDKAYKTYSRIYKTNKVKQIYVKCELNNPCISLLEDDDIRCIIENNYNDNKKYIILDEGIETAQCLTYADISSNETLLKGGNISNLMMLMVLLEDNSYLKLSYPILQLDEEENPDKLISKWLKENNIEDIVKELIIRPVNIVGNEHEILVFSAFINGA